MIQEEFPSVYCCRKPFSVGGLKIGVRSTIIKDQSGNVHIHSPVAFEQDDIEKIKSLGTVKTILAPNLWHHLYVRDAKDAFKSAKVFHAPGLEKKRKNFEFDGSILGDRPLPDEVEMIHIEGMPNFQEIVLFHKPTKTLLVTDLIFNLKNVSGIASVVWSKLFGTYNKPAMSRLFRSFIKDKKQFTDSLRKINTLDFENIVMSHGEVIKGNGKEIFEKLIQPFVVKC